LVVKALVLAVLFAAGCGPASPPASPAPSGVFAGSDGASHDIAAMGHGAKALVVTFFSPSCPCQAAHDDRLRALAAAYASRGVRFVSIDAEADATPARDRDEAARRGYAFPILADPRGTLADHLGADVATYSVVFDAAGRVRYRGGIDSDWTHPTPDAEPWLRDAIEAVLRDEAPRDAEKKALGCALRRR
jgi:hypothetical protein